MIGTSINLWLQSLQMCKQEENNKGRMEQEHQQSRELATYGEIFWHNQKL
jgi:hypothetical protein